MTSVGLGALQECRESSPTAHGKRFPSAVHTTRNRLLVHPRHYGFSGVNSACNAVGAARTAVYAPPECEMLADVGPIRPKLRRAFEPAGIPFSSARCWVCRGGSKQTMFSFPQGNWWRWDSISGEMSSPSGVNGSGGKGPTAVLTTRTSRCRGTPRAGRRNRSRPPHRGAAPETPGTSHGGIRSRDTGSRRRTGRSKSRCRRNRSSCPFRVLKGTDTGGLPTWAVRLLRSHPRKMFGARGSSTMAGRLSRPGPTTPAEFTPVSTHSHHSGRQ